MKQREWYSPWPEDVGKVVSEETCGDQKHKVFVFETTKGLYETYIYESTNSDVVEERSDAVGWFRLEGPSITDSLTSAKKIATEAVKRFSKAQ